MILCDSAPTDGNGPAAAETAVTPPAPAAPPAATAVIGGKTEREIQLETELENERARAATEEEKRIARERDIAELQDKHERYRKSVEAPAKTKSTGFRLPTVLD